MGEAGAIGNGADAIREAGRVSRRGCRGGARHAGARACDASADDASCVDGQRLAAGNGTSDPHLRCAVDDTTTDDDTFP